MTGRIRALVVLAHVLALAGLAAGCGGRAPAAYPHIESPREAFPALATRRCDYVTQPMAPHGLDALARPGTRGMLLLWGRSAAPTDTVELSVRYGDDGRLDWVRALRSNMARGRTEEVERMLSAQIERQGPPDWGVRVRIVEGRIDAILPSLVCPAEPMRVLQLSRSMLQTRESQLPHGHVHIAFVDLDRYGRVVGVRLARSTGVLRLDEYIMEVARSHRYDPKIHDGFALPTTVLVRISVRQR